MTPDAKYIYFTLEAYNILPSSYTKADPWNSIIDGSESYESYGIWNYGSSNRPNAGVVTYTYTNSGSTAKNLFIEVGSYLAQNTGVNYTLTAEGQKLYYATDFLSNEEKVSIFDKIINSEINALAPAVPEYTLNVRLTDEFDQNGGIQTFDFTVS